VSVRDSIENVLYSYSWGFSRGENERLAGCFAEHAEVVFPTGYRAVGRAAVMEELERRQAVIADAGRTAWIVITNTLIVADSPGEVSANSLYMSLDGSTAPSVGWYEDVFALADGAWRIVRRQVHPGAFTA
jgi:hypothetical protein